MPRIRSVHPAIVEDEALTRVSASAERTFVRLWTRLDDEGRAKDNPLLIKGWIYPLHESVSAHDVDSDLSELATEGLIIRYEVEGKRYLCAKPLTWKKYQKPNRPSPSQIPAFSDDSLSPHEQGDAGGGVGDGGGEGEETPPSPPAPVRAVFDAWAESTGRSRAKLDDKRRKLIKRSLENYPEDELIDAVRGWQHSPHHRGENDRHTVYNDIELLLRDAAHIEKFRDLQRDGPKLNGSTRPRSAAALDKVMAELGGPT